MYYHPLGENGQNNTPTVLNNGTPYGAVTYSGQNIPIYAMCEGTATIKTGDDGTSYCYISNKHADNENTPTYFEYKYGDFSIEDGATVNKGQQIGTTSDKGSTGTNQIQINLTTNINEEAYKGDASNGLWNGTSEINSNINQSTALGWAKSYSQNETNMAYNYLIFSGPLQVKKTSSGAASGAECEWQLVQDWQKGIEGYYTKGGITYAMYKQGQGPWNGICEWGCSVTCMASVISGYNPSITPSDTSSALGRNYPGVATGRMAGDLAKWGVQAHSTNKASSEKQQVIDWLNSGKILIANVNGQYSNKKSTKNGHFIVLFDYRSSDDSFFVGDPADAQIQSDWSPLSITWNSIVRHHNWVCYIDGGTKK